MTVSIVQSSLVWENKADNLLHFGEKLDAMTEASDVIVLPEMFTTGFTMSASKMAEPMDGPTVVWMREQSQKKEAVVTGSFICSENGRYYNRLVWMRPDGKCSTYDKRHLFTLAGEQKHYTPGANKRLILDWKGVRFCPLICYDLRFPVFARNSEPLYDVLLYVANWPMPRIQHWKILLQARAIENQSFCVGVNVLGNDANGHQYSGESAIVDYSGQYICQPGQEAGVFNTKLPMETLAEYRRRYAFLADRDSFKING